MSFLMLSFYELLEGAARLPAKPPAPFPRLNVPGETLTVIDFFFIWLNTVAYCRDNLFPPDKDELPVG